MCYCDPNIRTPQCGGINCVPKADPTKPGMDFGEALRSLRAGISVTRKGWNNPGISVHLQVPDQNSKMTEPYLYMEKRFEGIEPLFKRFPLDLSCESLLAHDWFEIE